MDPTTDQALDQLPLPPYVTAEDVEFAVRAMVTHTPEPAPSGARCRIDQAGHPCRLYHWGQRVLAARGLTEQQIAELISGASPTGGAR